MALTANCLLLIAFAMGEAVPQTPPPPAEGPEVVFTFDDGPKLDTTPKVLAELERRGIKAVFFVVGRKFEKDDRARDLLKQIAEQGHYIGNHTYSHRILCRHLNLAPDEIERNQTLIEEVLGVRPLLLRTPYGQHCRRLKQIVAERGFEQIGWDIDAQEWLPGSRGARVAKLIIDRLSKLKGRGIVLMHDTREATVTALPIILDWLDQHKEIKIADWRVLLRPRPPIRSDVLEALKVMRKQLLQAMPSSPAPVAALANLML
jgi:peptidoglycan/xylan/chitin deacetylase (PgdA/CDA1 family)